MKTTTQAIQDRAARRCGELADHRAARRVSSAIDAERRMNAWPVRDALRKPDPLGPSDPRYAYLTRTYD